MISFSARGRIFDIPYNYILENIKEGTLVRNLALLPENMVEKIEGSIFIDINPIYLDNILNCTFKKGAISNIDMNDENLCRELCYISAIDEYEEEWINVSLCNSHINNSDTNDNNIITKNKIIVINTCDKKKILLPYSVVLLWKDCMLKNIVRGLDNIYLISETYEHINIWIDMNYKMCHQLISIMRDGINVHHKSLHDNLIKKNILYYGLHSEKELNVLINRVKRMADLSSGKRKLLDISGEKMFCFTDEEREKNIYIEFENDWGYRGGGNTNKGPFHIVTDTNFNSFMNNIKDKKLDIKKNTKYFSGGREEYNETIWTYSIDNQDMDIIENYYFQYLMGYVN